MQKGWYKFPAAGRFSLFLGLLAFFSFFAAIIIFFLQDNQLFPFFYLAPYSLWTTICLFFLWLGIVSILMILGIHKVCEDVAALMKENKKNKDSQS